MKGPTKKQLEILEFILSFKDRYGFSPSIKEIMEGFGFKSPRTVAVYLEALEKKGLIKIHRGKARGIEVLRAPSRGVPLLGLVPAGSPGLVFEDLEEVLPVDPAFFGPGEKFALRVRGDSMVGAGIKDGDLVVLRKQEKAQSGQIVAVLLEGEVTLKRLRVREDGAVELWAENPAYPPITCHCPEDLRILGVMVGLLRKL